ncbi:MAG: hypothetical protein RLZZ306_3239 [Bacteroidota bacterium]
MELNYSNNRLAFYNKLFNFKLNIIGRLYSIFIYQYSKKNHTMKKDYKVEALIFEMKPSFSSNNLKTQPKIEIQE